MDDNSLTILGQDPKAVDAFVINSEDEAWELLERLQNDDFEAPEDIFVGDWANLRVYLRGQKFDSSITPSVFPVFQRLQKEIYHAYSDCAYGYRLKRLSNEEKEKLEIIIHVSGGSADTETKYNLNDIIGACVGKMTPKQIFTIAIIAIVVWGGVSAYGEYVQSKANTRILEIENEEQKELLRHIEAAGELDLKRMELVASISQTNDIARHIYEQSDDVQREKLRAATKAESSEISGVELNQVQAEELSKTKREKPQPQRIDGAFQILNLNWDSVEHAEIKLKRITDGLTVTAVFSKDYLNDEAKEIVKTSEWDEQGYRLIRAQINARVLRNKIVDADLMRVSAPEQEDYDHIKSPAEKKE